jgi:hypothetical protein
MYNAIKKNKIEKLLFTFIEDYFDLIGDLSPFEDKIFLIEQALFMIESIEYNEFK